MKQRAWYLLKTYLLTVAIFVIAKVVFMGCYHTAHPFTLTDVWQVITHGLSLDLSTALYFIILPWLFTIITIWHPIKSVVFRSYYIVIALAFSLAFVADTSLYAFWGFKLDSSCIEYLSTPTEAMASVSTLYLVVRLVLVVFFTLLISLAYIHLCNTPGEKRRFSHSKTPFLSQQNAVSLTETFFYLLLAPLIVIGIRGGVNESTTNIGQVYYSQNQFLNHSAVNPVFSFLSSFEKTASYIPDYSFMDETERAAQMEDLYNTKSENPDTLLNCKRPNVVVILLESCGGIFTEDIGGRKDIMPELNKLVHEGVYFANFYANSYRTDRGTLCTWSGYPSFPRSSLMKMPAKTRYLPGIAKTLREAGYHTSYLYGGDINFTNMRSYLVTTGFEKLLWQKNFTIQEQQSANWGVRDDITFNKLYDMITHEEPPFLIGFSTLSSHEPWDVPTHRLEDEILNAFNYLDECIGDFISKLKKTRQWDNLLIVLLPDHGFSYLGVDENHEMHDHVPMLWLGGAVKEPRRLEQFCNQTDLPATLLGQMALPHDDFLFSRDVVSSNYTHPFAVHTFNNGITMKDSTGFAVYDLNANEIVVDNSTDSHKLIRRGMAILQTAAKHMNQLE